MPTIAEKVPVGKFQFGSVFRGHAAWDAHRDVFLRYSPQLRSSVPSLDVSLPLQPRPAGTGPEYASFLLKGS
jgi:hypothetical protein